MHVPFILQQVIKKLATRTPLFWSLILCFLDWQIKPSAVSTLARQQRKTKIGPSMDWRNFSFMLGIISWDICVQVTRLVDFGAPCNIRREPTSISSCGISADCSIIYVWGMPFVRRLPLSSPCMRHVDLQAALFLIAISRRIVWESLHGLPRGALPDESSDETHAEMRNVFPRIQPISKRKGTACATQHTQDPKENRLPAAADISDDGACIYCAPVAHSCCLTA